MTNITAKIAGVATLALAVLPVAAISTAQAAPRPQIVKVAGLDLTSREGLSTFDGRVQQAGQQICREEAGLTARDTCQQAVRLEAREKLAQYMNARSAPSVVAAAR